ncbi:MULTISPECIES: pilus assembly protein TadG-related protein [unclassified Variovorax]|uniref:pilus assembly protein TadG-related protein n=1 Tax=unclassified Variovorax TaxID=663243 RepID=UPI003ED14C1B
MLSTRNPMKARQGGAVLITTALLLLFLLGFMGLALDFGRLFILKTELQTSIDSCALAAVQELDGASDALTRATNAGLVAGNLNKINFQGEAAAVADAEVTFSDSLNGTYSKTFAPIANAKYAKCLHTRAGVAPWLLQTLTAFSGDSSYGATRGAFAVGVATRSSAQSACAIPVRIRPRDASDKTNFGFTPGEWISTLYDEKSDSTTVEPGHFGWVNLDPGVSSSAQAIRNQLLGNGACIQTDAGLSTTGAKFSAALEWNSRFGLYKNGAGSPKITDAAPDLTGYSYTATNWPSQSGAASDFLAKRATHRSYGNTVDTVDAGDTITGLNIKGGYQDNNMGTYSAGPRALATYGGSRRLVMAPVMEASSGPIDSWACVLMLHPIDSVQTTVYLEYVGNAGDPSSPCSSGGLAGGASGPLVPVLVQ